MIRILINWAILTVAILLAAYLIPGIRVRSVGAAAIAAVILGAINLLLKPIVMFLSLPFIAITFGLFIFVINALLFWLAAAIVPGFRVQSFWPALLGALIVSVVTYVTGRFF